LKAFKYLKYFAYDHIRTLMKGMENTHKAEHISEVTN
jgi:hypothetical protein